MTHLSATAITLKNDVIKALTFQGFIFKDDTFHIPELDKSNIRNIHSISRAERLTEHINFIERFTPKARQFMLDSSELEISKIRPRLITVQSRSEHEKLFRWWNFAWWSLPYERSYGRQIRFIVWDDYHNAPIGIIGLQSPILSWSVRDNYLGISKDMRDFWINQSMNAQRLGALPPYNRFLGGKLVALLLTCDEIRTEFHEKYKNYETLLKKRNIPANLLFVTTTGAYGKSSVYNRLRFNGRRVCDFIGYTHGSGSFHIPNTLYEGFVDYLREKDLKAGRSFGNGPSVKLKIIDRTMGKLGFKNGVEHGIKRAVYLFPFAQNIRAVIHQGESPQWEKRDVKSLTKYWKERWAIKRVDGYPEEKLTFSKEKFLCEIEQDLTRSKNLVAGAQP